MTGEWTKEEADHLIAGLTGRLAKTNKQRRTTLFAREFLNDALVFLKKAKEHAPTREQYLTICPKCNGTKKSNQRYCKGCTAEIKAAIKHENRDILSGVRERKDRRIINLHDLAETDI